jgi:hypothetical protein
LICGLSNEEEEGKAIGKLTRILPSDQIFELLGLHLGESIARLNAWGMDIRRGYGGDPQSMRRGNLVSREVGVVNVNRRVVSGLRLSGILVFHRAGEEGRDIRCKIKKGLDE